MPVQRRRLLQSARAEAIASAVASGNSQVGGGLAAAEGTAPLPEYESVTQLVLTPMSLLSTLQAAAEAIAEAAAAGG